VLQKKYTFQPTTNYIFTAWCYASVVYGVVVCLCVTNPCSTKTIKHRITQTTPHNTPWTLVFWCQRSQRNLNGVTRTGTAPIAHEVVLWFLDWRIHTATVWGPWAPWLDHGSVQRGLESPGGATIGQAV